MVDPQNIRIFQFFNIISDTLNFLRCQFLLFSCDYIMLRFKEFMKQNEIYKNAFQQDWRRPLQGPPLGQYRGSAPRDGVCLQRGICLHRGSASKSGSASRGGVYLQRWICLQGVWLQSGVCLWSVYPPVNRQTPLKTLPSLAVGKKN